LTNSAKPIEALAILVGIWEYSMASWPDPLSLTALPSGHRQLGPLPVPEPEPVEVEEYRRHEGGRRADEHAP
jgi:hypothetical protein